MEYRLFGRTGMRVSAIGLGCGGFGGVGSMPELFGKGEDEATSFAIMDRAVELGINYFDTADAYGGGASETYIGRWITSRHARDQVVLSTKVRNRTGSGPNDEGLSRRHIMLQIDESLKRLQTDYLDLYVVHEVDHHTPIDETLRALDDLVHAGKVRYLGASNIEAWRLCKALWISDRFNLSRFESAQNAYNLLERQMEAEHFPLAADQQLAITPFSPLAGGFLTGKYAFGGPAPIGSRMTLRPEPYHAFMNAPTFAAIEALRAMATERGVHMASLALAWVIDHPQVTSALIGPRSLEQFAPVKAALELKLSVTERNELTTAMEQAVAGPTGLKGC